MATTNDLKNGLVLNLDGELWSVVEFQHVKPGKGGAFVRTKLKNVLSGKVVDRTFNAGTRVDTATVDKRDMQFLYRDGSDFVFMDTSTYDQVHIPSETIGDDAHYMPEQIVVDVLFFNERAVGVTLPNFIEQKILETEPGFRGDTATGVTKPAKISTGATIAVPLFINVGDTIKIDTRSGEYLERVGRA